MNKTGDEGQLSRRDLLKLGAGVAGGSEILSDSLKAMRGQGPVMLNRPNFVFFMTDGQRWDQLGIEGNKMIQTPNMDRLAREGIRFRNAFVTNALCAPSRATFLTGLYSGRNGVIDNKDRPIASGVPFISDLLHEAGYDVAFCGKSHVKGALRDHYWDYYFGYLLQQPMLNPRIAEGLNGSIGPDELHLGYLDDLITDAAVGWLQGRHEKPFCIFIWWQVQHGDGFRPRHLADLYDGLFVPKPNTFDDDLRGYPGKPTVFRVSNNKVGGFEWCATLEQIVKSSNANITAADEYIGRVLSVLERSNKLDETVIIHSSDHGFFLGEWHLVNKMLMHEPSIRIPLIIRYPKFIRAGITNDKMVLNLDVPPTILELARVKVPERMQGKSLFSFVKGEEPSAWRKDWLYEYYRDYTVPSNRGVRTERYKLIEYYEQTPKEYELYDLENDPGELRNLYGDPKFAQLTLHLMERLEELRRDTGEF